MSVAVSGARAVGELLRTRREALQPADVGLAGGGRRRTPGLRREEVAMLADVSTTYYTFLEQGRPLQPSRQVIDALSRALRLTSAERNHLHALAWGDNAAAGSFATEVAAAELCAVIDQLDPSPAFLKGRRWDVLAANESARELFGNWGAAPDERPNLLRFIFTDPSARDLYLQWEHEAAGMLGRFRAAAAVHPGDSEFLELIEELQANSPDVRQWWPRHDVAPVAGGTKHLQHPVHGPVIYRHVVLLVAEHPDQHVVAFTRTDEPT